VVNDLSRSFFLMVSSTSSGPSRGIRCSRETSDGDVMNGSILFAPVLFSRLTSHVFRSLSMLHGAELLVVDQIRDRGLFAADRACGVPLHLTVRKPMSSAFHRSSFPERFTDAEDCLHDLGRLQRPDHAGDHAEDTCFLARRHHPAGGGTSKRQR